MKKEINEVIETAIQSQMDIYAMIKKLSAGKVIEFFDPETIDNDLINEMPYSYFVSRHGNHINGVVQKVYDTKYTHYGTGEENGETEEFDIDSMCFESAVQVLEMLEIKTDD